MARLTQILAYIRNNWPMILREILINFALPYLIFNFAQPRIGDVNGLIASSAPPMLWSIVEFARNRRVDVLSLFVLLGIVLSLLAFLGGGSVQFLQLREKLVTVLFGIFFLGSAAIGRPLIYEIARASMRRANNQTELERFETLRNNAFFKNSMMVMTLVWGIGLLADAGVSIVLVYTLTIRQYMVVNPILGYATMGSLALWTFWFARKRRREGNAMREAQALADASTVQSPQV